MGYALVVCEKPDSARRVAEALSAGSPEALRVEGTLAFRAEDIAGKRYVVCAAMGHLYGVSDTIKGRRVYPAFDLEWFPLGEIDRRANKRSVSNRIRAIRSLAREADAIVNACDLDTEGETIGHNILRYACQGRERSALRAKFSALTKEEVVEAFKDGRLARADGLATAGRLRHAIDFAWGVNLSRALSESLRTRHGFRTLSVGRVQGPTLAFVVEREEEIRAFVPTPYWTLKGAFRKGDLPFEADYSSPRILPSKRAAEEAKNACEGREGVVSLLDRRVVNERPPPPFSLGDLQKEAFKLLGYPPGKTLRVAERLYLAALISYPRTASQKLPRTDLSRILAGIAAIPEYSLFAKEVISQGVLRPVEGERSDPAHPAIYPTGEPVRRPLSREEERVLDLVVRRFVSCFGEDAVREEACVEISVGDRVFRLEETRILVPGWRRFQPGVDGATYARGVTLEIREGDRVDLEGVAIEGHLRMPPARYNQVALLEKMEKEAIGTKATRADIISTLLERGYVTAAGQTMVPTDLGFSLIEVMREYCPQIISTRLTREIESQLERAESSGSFGDELLEGALDTLLRQIREVKLHEEEIGNRMVQPPSRGKPVDMALGRCPVCKDGKLRVVRSSKSGKRFVGCTNYPQGCRASAPLPQRGVIKSTSRPCTSCGWPVVRVRAGRHPWRLCVNDLCPRKVNVYAMRIGGKRRRKSRP